MVRELNREALIIKIKQAILDSDECHDMVEDRTKEDERIYRIDAGIYFKRIGKKRILTIDIYQDNVKDKTDINSAECAIDYMEEDNGEEDGPFALDVKDMTISDLKKLYQIIKELS